MAKQKEAWDKLSMQEKAQLIKLSVDNGVSSLKQIRDTYNLYANGGYNVHGVSQTYIRNSNIQPDYNVTSYTGNVNNNKIYTFNSHINGVTSSESTVVTPEFANVQLGDNAKTFNVGTPEYNYYNERVKALQSYNTSPGNILPEITVTPRGNYIEYSPYANGGNLAHKHDGEQVGQSQELASLAKPAAQQMTIRGFESPLAASKINQDVIQDYITRFTQEHPNINQIDLLASLQNVPLYEGSLGNGTVAAWMSGKQDQRGNFTHGVAFDEYQSNDKELNAGNTSLFIKAPKNALEHELLGHGARDIALGSTSGSTQREKEIIGTAYPFLYKNVYSHYKDNQAQHLLAEQLATNTQLRAMLQQNTGLYGEAFDKYVDSMSYEDLYNALYDLNSGYYNNSDLSNFFDYNVEYTENELNKINELQVQLQKIRDERNKLAYDIYEERQNENVRKILGDKYDSYFKDREKRKQNYEAQELEVQDQLYKLKETLGVKNYKNVNQIEAIKNALKTVAYNNINPFATSNGTYLAALGGSLTHKKSTGGPLYPFSFEKNPFLKTPTVRYDEGGPLNNWEQGALDRAAEVYSNYEQAKDNKIPLWRIPLQKKLKQLGLPSGLSNCTLTATQWVDPTNPIMSAATIFNNPKTGYVEIDNKDAIPGNLLITKNPETGSYHTMMIEGFTDSGEPILRYSNGDHTADALRTNISLSEYHSRDNSQGGNHTEDHYFKYNYPNEVFLPEITVFAKRG